MEAKTTIRDVPLRNFFPNIQKCCHQNKNEKIYKSQNSKYFKNNEFLYRRSKGVIDENEKFRSLDDPPIVVVGLTRACNVQKIHNEDSTRVLFVEIESARARPFSSLQSEYNGFTVPAMRTNKYIL